MADAGSQREESRPWQWSRGRKPDKTQRRDLASGVPRVFLNIYPQTPESACLIAYKKNVSV